MILGAISFLDCLVFCIFLAPQLIYHVGLLGSILAASKCLPFLLIKLPIQFTYTHLFLPKHKQSPFTALSTTSLFQDLLIRIVKYAFADLPSNIGRVFFSRNVALPFYRWRMLRHGYWNSDISWSVLDENGVKGIWIGGEMGKGKVDLVVYYIHGGGFAMGSPYFYLEFLVALCTLLKSAGYKNPAVFVLEYTLVPDAAYPTQLQEASNGYKRVVESVPTGCPIVISGDSAGGNLGLGLLLHLARPTDAFISTLSKAIKKPAYAVLISPWTTLISPLNANTSSDFLNAEALHHYGSLYARSTRHSDPYLSPGSCLDKAWWEEAMPENGMCMMYGTQEVFAAETKRLGRLVGAERRARKSIHAWPVEIYFLGDGEERMDGLKEVVGRIKAALPVDTVGREVQER